MLEPDPRSAPVLRNELNTCGFQGTLHRVGVGSGGRYWAVACLRSSDCSNTQPTVLGELLCTPTNESSCRPNLCPCDQFYII
jgi:hypothetical protein